jgi:thymidine phosphorylase
MDQVLGRTAGNALEVRESIDVLTGAGDADPRLVEVTLALARELLDLGGLRDADPAAALASGAAAEVFGRMVAALGGPADLVERPDAHLPAAPVVRPVYADRAGVVTTHATRAIGVDVMRLGGNRATETDVIDHAVGFDAIAAPGDEVGPGGTGSPPLCVIHARDEAAADAAERAIREHVVVGEPGTAPAPDPVVTEVLR